MNSLSEYFQTDWGAMTPTDWIGLILTVAIFAGLCGVYFFALRPKNRERLEAHRFIPLDEDSTVSGGQK